jgi:hypothetical protein
VHRCPECGADYSRETDSCATRFEQLLALDHSRAEPWGSRHGQAFAAFALQHPARYGASLDVAWVMLFRIYCQRETPAHVVATVRRAGARVDDDGHLPPRPEHPLSQPVITIADLGEFAAPTYVQQLDDWCRATLRAWGECLDGAAA